MTAIAPIPIGLILSGGLALGAYQAGAVATILRTPGLILGTIAGSSIGAINAAIIAGNPEESRVDRLLAFWDEIGRDRIATEWFDPFGMARRGRARHLHNWLSVVSARLTGTTPLFRPRAPLERSPSGVPSLYASDRLYATLARSVDFDRLNAGTVRYCCAATDIESGSAVFFDTAAGNRIEADHLVASGALLPAFAPVRIAERLLGDGGFSANAPLEPLLASTRPVPPPPFCFLIDLFAGDAAQPDSLEDAAERSTDLQFACQTRARIDAIMREWTLEARIDPVPSCDLFHLSYRGGCEEAGPEKSYDFSHRSIMDRIAAGAADAQAALAMIGDGIMGQPGLRVHPIRRRTSDGAASLLAGAR